MRDEIFLFFGFTCAIARWNFKKRVFSLLNDGACAGDGVTGLLHKPRKKEIS
jgi:hypothetical protein